MRIGLYVNILDLPKVEKTGFDYVELSVVDVLDPNKVSEQEFFNECVTLMQGHSIRAEAFNTLFPPDMKLVGEEVKKESLKKYLDVIIPRAKKLGARIIVWGSGQSRNVPAGFSREKAWNQLKEIIYYAATLCKGEDILIALEPLNSYVSNILNTIDECLRMAEELNKELNQDIIGIVADTSNMNIEELDFEKPLLNAKDKLFHVHFRDSGGRAPGVGNIPFGGRAPGLGHIPFHKIAQALKKINYRGRGSIEASIDLDKELIPSRDFLRKIFDSV
jgi:sugar phosphate isomerase/epimerase